MKIYVAYHKATKQLSKDSLYEPLHVGKGISKVDLGMIGDDTGDNISDKNGSFCEATGMYWMWKNAKDDYIGLSHYRRYFSKTDKSWCEKLMQKMMFLIGLSKKRKGLIYAKDSEKRRDQILDLATAKEILEDHDIILPELRLLKRSVSEQYAIRRPNNDLNIVGDIIKEKFPEYSEAFNSMMSKNEIYACNMFLMKKPEFDRYMEWLFEILFELEKRVDLTGYSSYHQRIYGFIAERLILVWLPKENLKIKELPVLYFNKL
ncbi:DUF4422 domain-containing protein [Marinifilum flexuosum]|uniref:DUF4422 domain-containing protein n=1 Tax=Marinifilum flexuosum TaxID=1117708 RepID=UPI00248F4949|nr:DUF4422 domain-containing protein [Marinifilum flexuosum]